MERLQVKPLTSDFTIPKSKLGTNIWGFFISVEDEDFIEQSWHKTYKEAVEAAKNYLQARFTSKDKLEESNFCGKYHASVIWGYGQGIETIAVTEIPPFKLKKPALVYILKQRGLSVKGSINDLRKTLEEYIKEENEHKKVKYDEEENKENDNKQFKPNIMLSIIIIMILIFYSLIYSLLYVT